MIYLDTSVMVAYVNERDRLHDRAVRALEVGEGRRVTSRLGKVELASVYARVSGAGGGEAEAAAEYTLRRCGASVVEVDWDSALSLALELAGDLRLRTLDLLHVVAASLSGADSILTFDEDLLSRAREVRKRLGLEVLDRVP